MFLFRFCEEDIDQILERRTQVITIDSVGQGSTFAKVHSTLTIVRSNKKVRRRLRRIYVQWEVLC